MASSSTRRRRYRTNTQDLDWTEERAAHEGRQQNIGSLQRLASAMAGGGLLAIGAMRLARRSWSGAGLSVLGAALLHRGLSGYCMAFAAMGIESQSDRRSTNWLGRRKVHSDRAIKIRRT